MDAPTSAGSWGGGGVLFWFTSWVDGSVVGGAVEAGAFVLLPTGDNVDDEFVSVTAAEEVGGVDVASAQSKNND